MATSQKLRPLLSSTTFHSAMITPEGSKYFIKKLLPAALAYIIHQRTDMDKANFETYTRNGIKFKTFKSRSSTPIIKSLREWITGAFDALDKNFLRELYLLLCKAKEPTDIIESYKFQFKYMGDDTMSDNQPDQAKLSNATDELFKCIGELGDFNKLKQDDIIIQIALTYYEDVTPLDYEPPFFDNEENPSEQMISNMSKFSGQVFELGFLKTGYHTIKCRARGDTFILNQSASTSTAIEVNQDLQQTNDIIEISDDECNENDSDDHEKFATPALNSNEINVQPKNSSINNSMDIEMIIKCACQINGKIEMIDLMQCIQCYSFEHTPCIGYLHTSDISLSHKCYNCKKMSPISYAEIYCKINKSLFRLSVAYAYLNKEVPHVIFNAVKEEYKTILLDKLKSAMILIQNNDDYYINEEVIDLYIKRLFPNHINYSKNMLPNSINLDDEDSMVLETISKRQRLGY